jgi:uncharacterized protein YhbP (UPF0306 family)
MNNDQDLSRIQKHLDQCRTLVLSTSDQNGLPFCAPVYYNPIDTRHVDFVSKNDSQHIVNLKPDERIAAAIFQEGKQLSDITGLQIHGFVHPLSEKDLPEARSRYMERYPEVKSNGFLMQMFMSTPLYRMEFTWMRFSEHINGWVEKKEWNFQ